MFWMIPTLFAVCTAMLVYILLVVLREAEEKHVVEYTTDTAQQFEDLFLFIPPEQIRRLTHITALVVFLLMFMLTGSMVSTAGILRGLIIASLCVVLVYLTPRIVVKIMKRRRLNRFNGQLSGALNGMSNALKAGFSIQQAFDTIVQEGESPIAQEFGMFLQQLRVGVRFEDALEQMDRRVGSEDLTLMIQSIEIARQTGGNLTEVFDRIDETIRERRRIEGKIQALTAQGRIQGRVVGAMPIILGFVLYLLDPPMMMQFLRSTFGMIILGIIFVMELLGAFFIRKIVNIDV
ncbi:MAG: type II secretion system F family protein [Pontiellaceae bacterium]|nr:type II secretion system F family protein [Pontiellaceae bacterium]MBN2784318.1 type II secretion system F family protein [Pontiellaceae bacterium]